MVVKRKDCFLSLLALHTSSDKHFLKALPVIRILWPVSLSQLKGNWCNIPPCALIGWDVLLWIVEQVGFYQFIYVIMQFATSSCQRLLW